MNKEEILNLYERRLSGLQSLDRAYFSNPSPTPAQRVAYYQRQSLIEELRSELYAVIEVAEGPIVENPDTFRVLVVDSTGQRARSEPQCRLSHDLKNCLHIILGSAQLLLPNVSNEPDATELLDHIVKAVDRMNDLISQSRCRVIPPPNGEPSHKPEPNGKKPAGDEDDLSQQQSGTCHTPP